MLPVEPLPWQAVVTVSCQDRSDDVAVDVGEAIVAAAETVGQPFMIQAEQVLHRGPEIIDSADVLHRVVAQFVGGSMGGSAFDSAAR